MANIFVLPGDVLIDILSYLDIQDRIAFALTCRMSRQICVDVGVFRKIDLSRCAISTTQRGQMKKLFRDRQLTQHIRELNVSNLHVRNWQMDDHFIKKFIIPNCLHLEALHVVNCGMSFQRLHLILQEAPKLTALSWSLWDFTAEDIKFLIKSIGLSEGRCFRNIRHLHLEMNESLSHFQIAKYLLLSCFGELRELEIPIWSIDEAYSPGLNFPHPDEFIPGFPQPSVESVLQHLHSLVVVPMGGPLYADYVEKVLAFVISVLRRKSSSTKWKKFWISPSVDISSLRLSDFSLVLDSVDQDDFQAVEAITVHPGLSANSVDEVKTFFQRIGDNTVRSLHLYLPEFINSIAEFCEPISRVGGHSLKLLRFSADTFDRIPADQNVFIHSLFSNCMNIAELDLLSCCFEKDICEPLSKLKHLTKVQFAPCAIFSRNQFEILKANMLTFVENCKNITHLDVCGHFSCHLTDDGLLAFAKLRKLKSLTLYHIFGIREWTFLQNISEHCKYLTTLRITACETFKDSHITILMESAKFLKHLAIDVAVPVLSSVFWNLLRQAKNLERLCIRSNHIELLNIPVAVETLKSLPRLRVLHLHTYSHNGKNVDFYDETVRMLEETESDCRFSFEIVTDYRRNTWISHETGYNLISVKALPLNKAELCDKRPSLEIPRFMKQKMCSAARYYNQFV